MATYQHFEDFPIWQKARTLFKKIINLTEGRASSNFRFKDQIIDAAGGVMDCIAEGFERGSRLEFLNFLSYAKGSTGEVRSQLYRGCDLHFWSDDQRLEIHIEYVFLTQQIGSYMKYLNQTPIKGQKFKDRK